LGDEKVKKVLVAHDTSKGVFMVRFYKEGYAQMVIVDDYLPIRADGTPSFVRGGD